jgi:hypothetical protein
MTDTPEGQAALAPLLADDALRALFEADPLTLTRENIAAMVDWARAGRARWQSEEKTARAEGRRPKSSVSKLRKAQPEEDPETASL